MQIQDISAGDMIQRKMGKIFKDLPNVFSIADDTLAISDDNDDVDHNKML